MSEYCLQMYDVCKYFPGVKALDHAKLSLKPGKVHALVGGNGAGKSTLMNCMFGSKKMDEGHIIYNGEEVNIKSPVDAMNMGISMVHQELRLVPQRTVAENIFLGRFPKKRKLGFIPVVDKKRMIKEADEALKKVKATFSSEELVKNLSVSQMQSIEIARAISAKCKILILDEPTSSLTFNETAALFDRINELKEQGVAIVYISHKMEEILKISDELTVMRDGQYIGTWDCEGLTTDFIISKMIGRKMDSLFPEKENEIGDVIFEVKNFTSIDPKSFKNVDFTVRRGEILGIGGLVGAQRTELMESIFGIRSHKEGQAFLKGEELEINHPQQAIKKKLAMLTEDRLYNGIFGVLSITDNTAIASLNKYVYFGDIIDKKKVNNLVEDSINKLAIKTPSSKTAIKTLSGGNQQKVLLARWLATEPDILILDEPTRGIDVEAKYEIYCLISELAKQGKAIIMISSEMEELMGMSDRIMVMCDGRVTGFLDKDEATQEKIMQYSTDFGKGE